MTPSRWVKYCMDIDDCNLGDEVIGGPVHKLLEANPAARRALAEIKHVEHGLARGSAFSPTRVSLDSMALERASISLFLAAREQGGTCWQDDKTGKMKNFCGRA